MARKKLTDDEAMTAIREAAKAGKVVMGPQDSLALYEHEESVFSAALAKVLGIRGAWMSDGSSVSDFPFEDDDYEALSAELGVPVTRGDLVVAVCRLIREKTKAGQA